MKKLSIGLFVAYLLFISSKSFISPVTTVELGVLVSLLSWIVGDKILSLKHRKEYREYLVALEHIEIQRPYEEDSEIAELKRETEREALKLKKFMTQQEYHKREIAKAVEKQVGAEGFRF